ncbi:MAG: metallophosphoesterase family protein [Alphaproteobacteria bacterium]
MSAFEVVQVSDTHLSRNRGYFHHNWRVFLDEMRADPPDLVVHSGDLSLRGTDDADDLVFARSELDKLPCPVLVVPGNHDIGDTPPDVRLQRPLNDERRANWRAHVGPEWDFTDLGETWRVVGLNAQLFDSGYTAEAEQLAWLAETLAAAGDRHIALFLHKPAFYAAPEEERLGLSCLFPTGRAPLLDLCRAHGVKLIGSGHLHVYRAFAHDGIEMVWSPATAFINSKEKPLPPVSGLQRRAGYIRYRLEAGAATHKFVEPDLFLSLDVRNWSKATGSTVHLPPQPLAEREIAP